MGDWIDISTPLTPASPVWPGDPPFEIRKLSAIERGDDYNLSAISMSCHVGTHVDAPLHFFEGRAAIDQIPLDALIGPARVIAASGPIGIEFLRGKTIGAGERILFKTDGQSSGLTAEAAGWLAGAGVRAVGIDAMSVGEPEIAQVHRALLGAGVWIIEVLDLAGVGPGEYEMICLPLRIVGAEGAPARAVLRKVKREE